MTEPSRRLTPDEITDEIHRLARDGDDREKLWALKLLKPSETSLGLPVPMSEQEVLDRVSRILKGIGVRTAQKAFILSYPAISPMEWKVPKHAPDDGTFTVPTSLKDLYEKFPEAERDPTTSYPPGYPVRTSLLRRRKWIYDYAVKLLEKRTSVQERLQAGRDPSPVPPEPAGEPA